MRLMHDGILFIIFLQCFVISIGLIVGYTRHMSASCNAVSEIPVTPFGENPEKSTSHNISNS